MRTRRIESLVTLLCASCAAFSSAIAQDNAPVTHPQAPAGFVLIPEEEWNRLSDEPDAHMTRARDAYLKSNSHVAATELRKAAVHLRAEASHAVDRTKRGLVQSEHELEKTAKRIEAGSVKSVEELDLVSARALHALANHQQAEAADAWRKRDAKRSGRNLRSAAENLERATARTDANMRSFTSDLAKSSRDLSGRIIEGTGNVFDEIGVGIEAIGHAVEKVGARVAPPVRERPE